MHRRADLFDRDLNTFNIDLGHLGGRTTFAQELKRQERSNFTLLCQHALTSSVTMAVPPSISA